MNGNNLPGERKIMILVAVLFFHLVLVSTNVILKNEKTLFQNIIGTIVSPFQIGFQKTVDFFSDQLKRYVFLKDSFKKYRDLKQKYTQLKYENYLLKKKINDQEFLEQVKSQNSSFMKAELISIDKNFPLTSISINKGSKDGIVKNMIVLNTRMELVGKIVEPISLFSSKVRLITSSIGGTGAYIRENKLEGLLTGNNTTICHFKYLIENAPVKKGDTIVTSGTDKVFLPGIPIGKVVGVEKEYLTQKIDVEPFFIKSPIKQLIVIANDDQALLTY
ncbi:MAG: rod shape-determining protein MreC [Candidatus Aminicenantes bacterium]|nr:MAG: rod shape-determining protein MreC [Candidatus Aminicenantes bacterium]